MTRPPKSGHILSGKLLIAMPSIRDANFESSVVLLCAHNEQGAMGLVINRPAPMMSLGDLLSQIDLDRGLDDVEDTALRMPIRIGGPVEQFRGFVLHSLDYNTPDQTLMVGANYGLTSTVDLLKEIASGGGPSQKLVALGYAGWAPGQLENEIQHNGWLHCEADDDLIFDDALLDKHTAALKKLGVDPVMLSADFGHA
jgi:putative transcriptional regulator